VIAVDTNVLVYAHRRDLPLHGEARARLAELAESAGAWAIPWPCLAEGDGFWGSFRRTLEGGRVAGGQVHDGRVAALCIAHGCRELWTADRDFGRFTGLRTRNPLVGR